MTHSFRSQATHEKIFKPLEHRKRNSNFSLIAVVGGALSFPDRLLFVTVSVSATLIVASAFSAFFVFKYHRYSGGFLLETSYEKLKAVIFLSNMLFPDLLLIPRGPLLRISDLSWSRAIKDGPPTVAKVVAAGSNGINFARGVFCLIGFYVGVSGEFGSALNHFADDSNIRPIVRMLLTGIAPWASLIFLFNGFFGIYQKVD